MDTIWAPLAGLGPTNGYRYRDTLQVLNTPEITQAHQLALAALRSAATGDDSGLDQWHGHAPALSVYAMWAVYVLEDRKAITADETRHHLAELAGIQRLVHHGRSSGWSAPPWWGTGIHAQHRAALIAHDPENYSPQTFLTSRYQLGPPSAELLRAGTGAYTRALALRRQPAAGRM